MGDKRSGGPEGRGAFRPEAEWTLHSRFRESPEGSALFYGSRWTEAGEDEAETFRLEGDALSASRSAVTRVMGQLCGGWEAGCDAPWLSLCETMELLEGHACSSLQRYSEGELRGVLEEGGKVLMYLPESRLSLLRHGSLPLERTGSHAVEVLEVTEDTVYVRDDLREDGARLPLELWLLKSFSREIWLLEIFK